MDTKKYEALLYAVEFGSFSAAAAKMDYTPAGISHMVEAVEQDLGLVLLHRGPNGVSLNENGLELLPQIRAIVHETQLLKSKAADINGIVSGTVTVGAYFSIATHWLPDIIRDFSAAHPGVSIQIREGGHQMQMQWLKEAAIDFAMCSFDQASPYRWIPLQDDPMVIVVPAAHPLAPRKSLSLKECSEEPFVMPAFGDDYDVDQAVSNSGVRLNIKYSTVENYSAIAMVESGLGISLMNRLITKGLDRKVVCVPLDPPVSVPLGILMPHGTLSPAAARMVSFIQKKLNA